MRPFRVVRRGPSVRAGWSGGKGVNRGVKSFSGAYTPSSLVILPSGPSGIFNKCASARVLHYSDVIVVRPLQGENSPGSELNLAGGRQPGEFPFELIGNYRLNSPFQKGLGGLGGLTVTRKF